MNAPRTSNDLLREQRVLRGWSQGKVADLLHVLGGQADSKLVGKWERGVITPSPFYRERLCLIYGCAANTLGFIRLSSKSSTLSDSEQQLGEIMAKLFDPQRRKLLEQMGVTNLSVLALPDLLDSDFIERIASAVAKPSYADAQTLGNLEKLSNVCWSLNNSNQTELARQLLGVHLPKISALAHQASSQQPQACSLVTRGYILAAEVEKQDTDAMQSYAQQAVFYSRFTHDPDLQCDALRQEATMALVAKQPFRALTIYQQALPLVEKVSPLLRSRIYLGIASAFARSNPDLYEQDALRYLGMAYDHFPTQPQDDSWFFYSCAGSISVLHFYEALTYKDLKQHKNAWTALTKVDSLSSKVPMIESGRLEFLNLQARTIAKLGNMEQSCKYLEASVEGADATGYTVWREEAEEVYQELAEIWPHELRIKRLGKLFQKSA